MLDLIEEMDRQGVTAQVDAQLQALPEQFEYPEAVKQYYREEFRGVLTSGQYQQLEEYLARPGTNEPAQRVLREGGISSYLRRKLAELRVEPTANLKARPLANGWCLLAICAAAVAAALCAAYPNTEICENAWWVALGICIGALACLI
jgi:hypothetical protein